MSDNRDYRDNRDYHLYKIDMDNPCSFDQTHFATHFVKQEGRFACFALIRGDRGPERGQRAVEGAEGRRGEREPYRGQRAVEGTEGRRGDRGP